MQYPYPPSRAKPLYADSHRREDVEVSSGPETRFVRSGDVDIAYQVFGGGPRDILALSGFVSHLEVIWELAEFARFLERLGSMGREAKFLPRARPAPRVARVDGPQPHASRGGAQCVAAARARDRA